MIPTHHFVCSRPGRPSAGPVCDECFHLRAVEVAAHDTHPFAIAPVELPASLFEMELLWRERAALRDDGRAILPVEVRSFDGPIVLVRHPHVGPVDVTCFGVDDDPVGQTTIRDEHFAISTVGVQRQYATAAKIENEEPIGQSRSGGTRFDLEV